MPLESGTNVGYYETHDPITGKRTHKQCARCKELLSIDKLGCFSDDINILAAAEKYLGGSNASN